MDGHSLLHLAAVMAVATAAAAATAAAIGDVIRLFNDHSGVPALWTPDGGCRLLSACPCVWGRVGQSGVAAAGERSCERERELRLRLPVLPM